MGKIKKLLESELIGGSQNSDIYPVTSTRAVYDEDNRTLDSKLTELEGNIGVKEMTLTKGYNYLNLELKKDSTIYVSSTGLSDGETIDVEYCNFPDNSYIRLAKTLSYQQQEAKFTNTNKGYSLRFHYIGEGSPSISISFNINGEVEFIKEIASDNYTELSNNINDTNKFIEGVSSFIGNSIKVDGSTITIIDDTLKIYINRNNNVELIQYRFSENEQKSFDLSNSENYILVYNTNNERIETCDRNNINNRIILAYYSLSDQRFIGGAIINEILGKEISDLNLSLYSVNGRETELLNDIVEKSGYYNSYTNKENFKGRKIYKGSSIVFNATGLSDGASITVEVREDNTYATYIGIIGTLTSANPSLMVENWDYEKCLYGFNAKNIDDPVNITTEVKLTGKIEQIEAIIGTKILKPSSGSIVIAEGESYVLTKNLDFSNVTLNMGRNSQIIFNGYTISCNRLVLVSSFIEEDGINNAPMLDFSKTGGFNVRAGTYNITGLFRTDNNKLNIHSFSFDPRYDLGVMSHFKNTEFYITKSFSALYNASIPYEIGDNCSLCSKNESIVTFETPLKIKGKNVVIHDLKCKGSYCFTLLEDSLSLFENVEFEETENSISCIRTSLKDFSKTIVRNCKFMNNGTGIGIEGLFKNSIFEYNIFNCKSSIRISRGYNNRIHFNTMLSGITGILNSFSLFSLSKEFVIKNGFSGNTNNIYSNNKLYGITEENISFDYTPVNNIYEDGKIPLYAPNRNSCVISSINTIEDLVESAIVTFDGIDIFDDGEDAIPYYKNMVIYYLSGNKAGNWSVIESVTKQNGNYEIKVKGNNTFWLGASVGDRLSVSCGFINNVVRNNTYYNTSATSVAFYIGCFGCTQSDEIIVDRKYGNWDTISYIQAVKKIPRSINVYSCDNTICNIRCINDMQKEDRPSRIVMQAFGLVEEVEIPSDVTEETLFRNRIENCLAGRLQLYKACYNDGNNQIIGGVFGELVKEEDTNRIYIINSLIKTPMEIESLKSLLLEGSILYNNGRLNYKNAIELISL